MKPGRVFASAAARFRSSSHEESFHDALTTSAAHGAVRDLSQIGG